MFSIKRLPKNEKNSFIFKTLTLYRQMTWQYRSKPDFIIIGAQKAGTSSLFSYLRQHPQIVGGFKKEIHFFDGGLNPHTDNFVRGRAWYASHFPIKSFLNSSKKAFEASPFYIFNPLVPKRIFEFNPNIKLIALLRNPTHRAISHYYHEKKHGQEHLPILQALEMEEARIASAIKDKNYNSQEYNQHSYKTRGLYKEQLQRFFEYFSSDQILVIQSELLFSNPKSTLKEVFEFVGVDKQFKIRDYSPKNIGMKRKKEVMDVYSLLNHFFKPHNKALYDLIGKDFGW